MGTLLFFYGLAFITFGIAIGMVVFILSKEDDYLNLSSGLWLLAMFGLIQGLNEWLDLLILRGEPFSLQTLRIAKVFALAVSFVFLIAFGGRLISDERPWFRWPRRLWLPCLLLWLAAYFFSKDFLLSGIVARYFLCIPAALLTAAGLHLKISKIDRKQLPQIVYISAQGAIYAFIIFGILDGLVTPPANFFPASIINYPNFVKLFRLPVQLFRLLAAVVLTVSFFGIFGFFFYKKEKAKISGGISGKLTLIICSSILVIMVVTVSLGYFWQAELMRATIGEKHALMARLLANTVTLMLDDAIAHIESYSDSPLWKKIIAEVNLKYADKQGSFIQKQLRDMDKQWAEAGEISPLCKDYLESPLSARLKALLKNGEDIARILVTDRFGGLVASTHKIPRFYHADTEWWQKAFAGGAGKIFLGNLEFDALSNIWAISVAVPIRDEKGRVIGVSHTVINVQSFFSPLETFRVGETGHTALVDEKGYVIFHRGVKPLSVKLCSDRDFQKLIGSKRIFSVARLFHDYYTKKFLIAFAEITQPFFLEKGMLWRVFITQDAKEAFAPLNLIIFQALALSVFIILIMIPIAVVASRIFLKPLHELHIATERIASGDWDYKPEIKTGDEIEQFANAFGEMVLSLKQKQAEILKAKSELEEFSRGLEAKVKERTEDLVQAQEATLSILEDLAETKDRLDKHSKELEQALKIKSDFTSNVSHELRTPLVAIKEGVAIVLEGLTGDINPDQKKFLEAASKNTDRLTRLINNILDFQKLEAGKMSFKMEEDDINEVVKEIKESTAIIADKKGLRFILNLEENLPKIKFDREKIGQVLINLINNAIKFTEKGSIAVATSRTDQFIRVEVVDTGGGIKKEDIPRLFQQYEQLQRAPGGTGLGLVICKEIIKAHGGKIWAESEPGVGSTFYFTLPFK